MSKMHKKVCMVLNYIEYWLILPFVVTGCISISASSSLLCIPVGVMSSPIGLLIK